MGENDLETFHQELDEIRTLIRQQQNQQHSIDKYTKVIQTVIYVLVLVIGLGASWGMMNSKLTTLDTATDKISSLESRLHSLEIKQAAGDEILKMIRSDISEIKDELKKFNKGQR
jgi:hypothetical protein